MSLVFKAFQSNLPNDSFIHNFTLYSNSTTTASDARTSASVYQTSNEALAKCGANDCQVCSRF